MAALARRFPGALRELDSLPLAILEARRASLVAAQNDPSRIEEWMRASSAFHRLARGALTVKRWLSARTEGRPAPTVNAPHSCATLRETLEAALGRLEHGEDARHWLDALGAVARPPRGRLLDLVYARLAEELGISVAAARALLGPPSDGRCPENRGANND